MSTSERLSMAILRNLQPSELNPITVKCDDGFYTNVYSVVTIIGLEDKKARIINASGHNSYLFDFDLAHYPAPKATT